MQTHTMIRPNRRIQQSWWTTLLLAAVLPTMGGSAQAHEAIKKAVAATVAIEWRAADQAGDQPAANYRRTVRQLSELQVAKAEANELSGLRATNAATAVANRYRAITADLALSSGVIVSADGLIVTFGRSPGEGRYNVLFDDGRSLPARIVVDDRRNGLRLLKIDGDDLPHISLAESEADIGDQVFATFCSDRRERTVAQGIIAGRRGTASTSSLQLDLTIGPMSTGGAVLDGEGRLVGIITGQQARSPAETLANFAVPLGPIRALMAARQGENTVVVHRGFLGIQLDSKSEGGREHVIVHLLPDSPAAAGGMHDGDELVAIDGEKVTAPAEAAALVARHAAGETISVTVSRSGEEKKLEITVGRPSQELEVNASVEERTPAPIPPTPGSAFAGNFVRPEKLYVLSQDGKRIYIAATEDQLEPLRNYARSLRLRTAADGKEAVVTEPVPNVIRVERSDLEKKLEEFSHHVDSLQQQVEKLTDEIKSLRTKLGEQK